MTKEDKKIERIIVRPSGVHGRGVFANTDIPKDTVLHWENTKELTQQEFSELSQSERRFTEIQNGRIFLVGEPERYVNHSCDNNTVAGDLCDIASRDILKGEEITADYSHFFILDGSFVCQCGSQNCRKVITGRKPE